MLFEQLYQILTNFNLLVIFIQDIKLVLIQQISFLIDKIIH